MDSAARFCLGWSVFVGLPFVVMVGTVPDCLKTSEFATMVATTGAMLMFGVAGFMVSWKRSNAGISCRGFAAHCRAFFRDPEKRTRSNQQIDNQEQEIVQ